MYVFVPRAFFVCWLVMVVRGRASSKNYLVVSAINRTALHQPPAMLLPSRQSVNCFSAAALADNECRFLSSFFIVWELGEGGRLDRAGWRKVGRAAEAALFCSASIRNNVCLKNKLQSRKNWALGDE